MRPRFLPDWRVIAAVAVVAVIALLTGVTIVSANERNDQFCGSCHTQPETTYLSRFQEALAGDSNDLAAFHHKQLYPRSSPNGEHIRCIDCHVGEGALGRGLVVSLAAWDALKYVTGNAQQPARVIFTVQNEGCQKCHEEQVQLNLDKPASPFIIDNHFHYKLYELDAPSERCVDCHIAHRQGVEDNGFQFRNAIIPVCEDCHRREGKGPVKM